MKPKAEPTAVQRPGILPASRLQPSAFSLRPPRLAAPLLSILIPFATSAADEAFRQEDNRVKITGPRLELTLYDGVVTGLRDRRTGEEFSPADDPTDALQELPQNGPFARHPADAAPKLNIVSPTEAEVVYGVEGAATRYRFRIEPDTGDLLAEVIAPRKADGAAATGLPLVNLGAEAALEGAAGPFYPTNPQTEILQ